MTAQRVQTGTRFAVSFGELKLPEEIEKSIESEIQKVVLRAIADIDFRGDLRIGRFPTGTLGITIDPIPTDFPPIPPRPS